MGVVLVIFLYNIFWLLKKKMNLENDSKSQSKRDCNSNTMPGVASLLEWMNMAADLANSSRKMDSSSHKMDTITGWQTFCQGPDSEC